jgi:hypothetical protein
MTRKPENLVVKSHVARDLLQNAGLFKTDKLVVWEYVSNGLQYVEPGTNPIVRVTLDSRRKRIIVADNGRGMDWADLQNFFVMHGENIDRKEGRPGRGRFGTGKSAAFGVANVLRLTTVRNGKQSIVELHRSDIERIASGDPIPVRPIKREVYTDEPNGTLVEIEQVHLRSLDQAAIIKYIERHLARWPKNSTVYVNNHECEFAEPPVEEERLFVPADDLKGLLGDVELTLKVSKVPLEQDLRGVAVFSNGVWYETTLAGSESREMSQYIFGEIDVPKLDTDDSPIPPFDMSRSMRLNPNNEIVRAIYAFIGEKVEELRRQLVAADRKRKQDDEARKLTEQAEEIAQVINEDFDEFRRKLTKARARGGEGSDYSHMPESTGSLNDDLVFGSQSPAEVVSPTGGIGKIGDSGDGGEGTPRNLTPVVRAGDSESDKKGRPAGGLGHRKKKRGGFQVQFKNMGGESYRARYVAEERTIYINIDHPQLLAAKGLGSVTDPAFKRLAYEVAFAEYSVALAYEMANHDFYIDPTDPIYDIRETLNRIARKAAALYSE